MSNEISFTVPLVPPSVNHYKMPDWSRRRFYVTPEAASFKSAIAIFAKEHTRSPHTAECAVEINVYLGRREKGDVDNFAKVCLDGLVEAGVLGSDAAIQRLTLAKFRDWENPRTEITVRAL